MGPPLAFALAALAAAAAFRAVLAGAPGATRHRGGRLPRPYGLRRPGTRPCSVHRPAGAAGQADPVIASRVAALVRGAGLSQPGVDRRPWLLLVVLAATVGAVTSPVAPLTLLAAVAVAPRLLAPVARRRQLRRRDEQLAPWLERIASGLRAGLSLPTALAATIPVSPAPLRSELLELEATMRAGDGLADGLARWAASPGATPAVALVAGALDLGIQAGGEVARALDRVAATLRDRMEAQAEVRALATQARASAIVLAVAPLGFCALLATVEPAVPRILLTTPLGWACLAGGLGLEAAGAAWMARIVTEAR